MKYAISVIIITKDRPEQLLACLQKLQQSSLSNFELIVIDQSKQATQNKVKVKELLGTFAKAKYIASQQIGKSKGLNQALLASTAPLLAFTDDDCLPDKKWLQTILDSFQKNKSISGVFGRTIAHQPQKHKGLVCPACFDKTTAYFVKKPCKHWQKVGFGNNMAWRKSFFEQFGLFKEWLGPGSIGSNAEDAEIALRALINKQTLFYNPAMVIEHNKWLTQKEMEQQELSYLCGEMACYGYLAKNNHPIGKLVVKENMHRSMKHTALLIKNIIKHPKEFLRELGRLSKKIAAQLRGFFVALTHS